MAQAEKDIRDAAHTGEIGDILAKAKTDMENALHTMKVSFRLIGDFLHEEQGDEPQGLCDMDSDEDLFSQRRSDGEGFAGKGTG